MDLFVGNFNGEVHYYRNIGDKYTFDFTYVENIGGILATAFLVGVVGVLSSLDVLYRKPMLALRTE